MAYIECPECGQRALSVATQCPRCGHAFQTDLLQHPVSASRRRRAGPLLVLAGIVLALVLALALGRDRAGSEPLPARSEPLPADTTPSDAIRPGGDSVPVSRPALQDSAASFPPATAAPPPAPGRGRRRYARTWVNLRGARSGRAPVVGVLRPGQAVLVDSLRRGWYRVLADGRAIGYVDRSYLDTVPPSADR